MQKGLHIPGDTEGNMWSPGSKQTSKPTTTIKTNTIRILQITARAKIAETQNTASTIHISRRQLWSKICWKRHWVTLDKKPKRCRIRA